MTNLKTPNRQLLPHETRADPRKKRGEEQTEKKKKMKRVVGGVGRFGQITKGGWGGRGFPLGGKLANLPSQKARGGPERPPDFLKSQNSKRGSPLKRGGESSRKTGGFWFAKGKKGPSRRIILKKKAGGKSRIVWIGITTSKEEKDLGRRKKMGLRRKGPVPPRGRKGGCSFWKGSKKETHYE